jgi:hypothetical protein
MTQVKFGTAIAFAVWVALADPASAIATCKVDEKQSCSAGDGCQAVENKIIVRIDLEKGTYSRCDAKGCDDFSAHFSLSGDFIIADVPGRGMFAKMSKNGSSYVEVVSLMTTILVSFGSCQNQ